MQDNHGKVVHIMSPSCCRQVEMARLRREEEAASAAREREQLEQTVRSLEQELAAKQEEAQAVQVRGCWMIAMDGPHCKHLHMTYKDILADSDRKLKAFPEVFFDIYSHLQSNV